MTHALVLGASGLIGWSVVAQLLSGYPSSGTFTRITAVTNRPLSLEESFWPTPNADGPTLELVSGVDLTKSEEEVEEMLKKVQGIEGVRVVFYFAFLDVPSSAPTEVSTNVSMLHHVVHALKTLSPTFRSAGFVVYPGGTRGYGIYRPGGVFRAPLTEDLADALPSDYAQTVAYPHYRALLRRESAGQAWGWCELCPDAIIGFTPNGSGYSLAGHWAVYLYAWKLVHGEGAEVPFPGSRAGWEAKYTETSTRVLARVAVWAAVNPEGVRGKVVNVADTGRPGCMAERWPEIAAWFGLKGVEPTEREEKMPSEFIKEQEERLREEGAKGVGIWNAKMLDSYGYWLTFDRHLSLERLRKAGFVEERPPRKGWEEAFDMFRKAGMIGG